MEKLPYYDTMTSDMQEVVDEFGNIDDLKELWVSLYFKCKKARKAYDITLPATSASGKPVLAKSKYIINDIADFYYNQMRSIESFLPHEWVVKKMNELGGI